jgi:tRNA (guanosine-2'-O-)-methyltransferase
MSEPWLDTTPPDTIIEALAPFLTEERKTRIEEVLAQRLAGLTVILENLHDSHNGAAALRSVEGFGLAELHVVEQAEPFRFSSKVTQGCEKWVSRIRHKTFAECADELHRRGFQLVAALPGAETALDAIDVSRPTALVFGNEHAGLTGVAQAACDGSFAIPMAGFTQSFNLSVSVAISLYDAARRRRQVLGSSTDLPAEEVARLRARWYALSMDLRSAHAIVEREKMRAGGLEARGMDLRSAHAIVERAVSEKTRPDVGGSTRE